VRGAGPKISSSIKCRLRRARATSILNKIKPTQKSIQKEYVQKRQRALEANDPVKTEHVK
jgi:hypothetical protein